MSYWFFIGAALAVALIIGAGVLSGRRVKTAREFEVGGGAGTALTVGAIMTSLVGGNCTVGTAQLAYVYGFSAWWYTIGAALGCVFIALVTAKKLQDSGEVTMGLVLRKKFGASVQTFSSLCVAVGSFINLIAQLLAGSATMATLLPGCGSFTCLIAVALIVLLYVVFGGARSTGTVGMVKTALLVPALLICGVLAWNCIGGTKGLQTLPKENYLSLFARGAGTDLSSGLSLMLGVVSAQAYTTAALGAKDIKTARRGLIICAVMLPVLGVCGVLIGIAMRVNAPSAVLGDTAAMAAAAKTAFPEFVQTNCSPFVCGIILATLLIAAAGSSAGVLLALSTILRRDLIDHITDRFKDPLRGPRFSRVCLIVLLFAGVCFSLVPSSFIIDLGFLASGLRAATLLAPLLAALYFPKYATAKTAFLSIAAGVAGTLAAKVLLPGSIPAIYGMFASFVIMAAGLLLNAGKRGQIAR